MAYLTTENLNFPSAVTARHMEGLKPREWVEDQILDFVLCYLSKLTGAGFDEVRINERLLGHCIIQVECCDPLL